MPKKGAHGRADYRGAEAAGSGREDNRDGCRKLGISQATFY